MNADGITMTLTVLLVLLHVWKAGCRSSRGERYRRITFEDDPVISYDDDDLYAAEDYEDYDNGALSILLSMYSDRMVDELQEEMSDRVDRLTQDQAMALKDKLKGLYAHLKDHPALMERRLYVGSKKPQLSPRDTIKKRDFLMDIAHPVCPASTEWRQLEDAKDINDTDVEVYQPHLHGTSLHGKQWFHTVECRNNYQRARRDCPDCCMGIDHTRFSSSCRQRKTYVMAYVRHRADVPFDWNWIQVDTSCNCAITRTLVTRRHRAFLLPDEK